MIFFPTFTTNQLDWFSLQRHVVSSVFFRRQRKVLLEKENGAEMGEANLSNMLAGSGISQYLRPNR